MKLTLYQIDAFADKPFRGNPAAVCPLDHWLADELLQSIAMENNLSETAFFVATAEGYHIRWFTPTCEVDLCGHATLASAYVLFDCLGYPGERIEFQSRSGRLIVERDRDFLVLDFPARPPQACEIPKSIVDAFEAHPIACLKSEDYIVVFENEEAVLTAKPDLAKLKKLDLRGVAITARSGDYDFVTRFFAPNYGIDEDPVTGSAYTQLLPYWSQLLGKAELTAKQVSGRGGIVFGRFVGNRVKIGGKAAKYMVGTIQW